MMHAQAGDDLATLVLCLPQAVAKFKQALGIDPSRHDTLWCLGNAYTSQVCVLLQLTFATLQVRSGTQPNPSSLAHVQGFLTASSQRAKTFFDKASTCFQDAVDQVCFPSFVVLGLLLTRAPLRTC